jgi:hypothetical protein
VSWKRLSGERAIDPDFYVEEGPDVVYKESGLSHRVYGWKGRMWPRLSVSVHEGWDMGGAVALREKSLNLSCAYKSRQGQWWSTLDGVPLSLFDEALEMLEEAKSKVAGSQG